MIQSVTATAADQLRRQQKTLLQEYEAWKRRDLHLNMARGKPSPAQLDLSMDLLKLPEDYHLEDGTDARKIGRASCRERV